MYRLFVVHVSYLFSNAVTKRHAVEERHPGMLGIGEDGFRLSPE